jgi:NAD kinase
MKILIVAKQSKYEWEQQKFNLSHDELVKKYNKERANLGAILSSHEKQLQVRGNFANVVPNATKCLMDQAPNFIAKGKYDLIIVLGGDNSFTYVSHYANDIPILGVNSDPERSVGCLTRWSIGNNQDVFDLIEMLDFGEFDIKGWTRLNATINGKLITPATSEYFFGERMRKNMSRHVLVYNGVEHEQKCSGIIFATGCGSTGWYSSSTRNKPWSVEERKARFAITEPYNVPVMHGDIEKDDEIILYSLNDSAGYASADSWEEFEFTRGSEARIYLGAPLNVVIPKKEQDG